jgi:Family of unknown function (DUF6340)
MKVFVNILLQLVIIMALSSCIRVVYISKKTAPEISLEKEHHNIVFVNLFNYNTTANVNKKERTAYHSGINNLLEGLSSFSSDSSFSFVIGDTLKKIVEPGFLTTMLPVDTINNICSRFTANLLLTLDSASIFFERDTVVSSFYGSKYRTINFELNARFFLSLYSDEGNLIDRSEVEQSSIFIPRSLSSGYILIPAVSRATEEIGNLAFQAGQDYVTRFYPQIIHDTKQLFTGSAFRESNQYIFKKDWKKATKLLEQLASNPDPAIAAKAKHNLEVVKEASEAGER